MLKYLSWSTLCAIKIYLDLENTYGKIFIYFTVLKAEKPRSSGPICMTFGESLCCHRVAAGVRWHEDMQEGSYGKRGSKTLRKFQVCSLWHPGLIELMNSWKNPFSASSTNSFIRTIMAIKNHLPSSFSTIILDIRLPRHEPLGNTFEPYSEEQNALSVWECGDVEYAFLNLLQKVCFYF